MMSMGSCNGWSRILSTCSKRVAQPVLFHPFSAAASSPLAELRRKTGYPMIQCKKAIDLHGSDLPAAQKWLNEEAAKHGWAKVSKLQNRSAAEGLIGVSHDVTSNSATLLEINCETDFVSRNENFRSLVAKLTHSVPTRVVSSGCIKGCSPHFNQISYTQNNLIPLKEDPTFLSTINKLAENMVPKRALTISVKGSSPEIKLATYAHSVTGQMNQHDGCFIGKYGVIMVYSEGAEEENLPQGYLKQTRGKEVTTEEKKEVTLGEGESLSDNEDNFDGATGQESIPDSMSQDQVAKVICQHIIGLKPIRIRKTMEEMVDQVQLVAKYGGKGVDQDPDSLLDQDFLLNDKITVRQLLKDKNMKVHDFFRYETGTSSEPDK